MFKAEASELDYFIRPSIGAYTFSESAQAFINTKYHHCLTNHTLCRTFSNDIFFPTRVLDVSGPSPSTIRLTLATSLPPGHHHQYATLSHCWGKAQLTVLQTALLPSFTTTGIALSSLPKTFQESITVTRFLGLRYLWIDSLCIIQDSAADWQVESALMASVYGFAMVNIAAASSSDSRGGLFFERDPDVVQPFAAHVSNVPGLEEGWYLWKKSCRWAAVGEQPLHKRGWVLQERLLSARTLHFSRTEVFWHCLEELASEAVPNGAPEEGLEAAQVMDYTDMRITIASAQQEGLTERHSERLRLDWKRVVGHYSRCGLTQQRDTLVALSGLVQRLEGVLGDECLAGLWRSEMPACLVWYADWEKEDLEEGIPPPPEVWLAPSWSWASRKLPVEYPRYDARTIRHATVVQASVDRAANGLAISGRMVIRGPLVDLTIKRKEGELVYEDVNGGLSLGSKIKANTMAWMDGRFEVDESQTMKGMLILENFRFIFILLQQLSRAGSTESGSECFQRVGLALMDGEFWAKKRDVESVKFIQRVTSEDLDLKRSAWAPYIQEIRLE